MTTMLSEYLGEIARIRATRAGTAEMSYYPALQGALNAVGATLRPRVFCVPNLSSRAGFPDLGLFVAERLISGGGSRPKAAMERPIVLSQQRTFRAVCQRQHRAGGGYAPST